jgi:hypothetical protein
MRNIGILMKISRLLFNEKNNWKKQQNDIFEKINEENVYENSKNEIENIEFSK